MTGAFLLFFTPRGVGATPANWIRSDEGLTLTSSQSDNPHLFSFDRWVYVRSPLDKVLYVQLYNSPCFGWQQVTVPAGSEFFKPVGDYLYAIGSDLWWVGLGGDATLPTWTKVSSTGLPAGSTIRPQAVFQGQLYAEVVTAPGTFDIYRTPDIGKPSMAWTQVVSAGFGHPFNHHLGGLIEYKNGNKNTLIAITDNTRTDPSKSFGDPRYYGPGIQVWESSTGDLGSWTQVNEDGFGTTATAKYMNDQNQEVQITVWSNQDFGSAAVYNDYLYVGTKAHWHRGEVWRYNGTGWTDVTPDGMCAGMIGCGGPSRATDMVEYNGLLYLAEGIATGNLETYDGTTWTIVVGSEINPDPWGHPFDVASRGIYSLAVLRSLPTPPWGSGETGDKLFALTTTEGGAEIWSYPFSEMPLTCTALKQATITIIPKTTTSELFKGATNTVTVKVDAGSGFDFSQVNVGLEICVDQNYYGGGGSRHCSQGWVPNNGTTAWTYGADFSGPTPPLNSLYPDQIQACFFNSENVVCDTATHTWVDTKAPTITITTPTDGAKYLLNQVVSAQYSIYDAVGVLKTTAPVPVGGPIPTGNLGNQTFTVTATDYGNNTNTVPVTYTVETSTQGTQDLKSEVSNSPVPQDIKKGLNDKLDAAINALNKGNKKAAINILQAFINMVKAQRGKKITNAQADSWIAEAQKIIDSINAS
jgi:hypothetical protein